jgi:2'-5' RNA ligase
MRLFTALRLSAQAKQELLRVQSELKKEITSRKWVPASQFHLTLHFLGEIPESKLEHIQQEIGRIVAESPAFSLQLSGLGAFPDIKRARVIWAGITEHTPGLYVLQQKLAEHFTNMGIYQEKRSYRPHITLGREPTTPLFGLQEQKLHPVIWRTQEIVLFHSTLTPQGPVYRELGIYPLQ